MTQISKVSIRNILGIEELNFDAGTFTEISGPNGAGKTSILEAIKAALRGGHDATLLRTGAEKGEAVIVLDDGTSIAKRVNGATSTTIVTGSDGKRSTRPAEDVRKLADLLSVNPVDFLRATKKERVSVLLESMPFEINAERLEKIAGGIMFQIPSGHALVVLETVRKAIYDERTGTARAQKEKVSTINQLAATLPDESVAIESPAGLVEQLHKLGAEKDAELDRIKVKLDALRAESNARIDELRRQIDAEAAAFAELERKAVAQRERTLQKHSASASELRAQVAAIQEAEKAAARHENTRSTIGTLQADADKLQADSERYTTALDQLDAYKSELLAGLPIPGLSVVDGEIYREGVPFDRLNTAQQVQIAVEIAKLRAGELPVVCVDGLELLDSTTYAEFQQQAIDAGMQMFVTRVSDGEFSITAKE